MHRFTQALAVRQWDRQQNLAYWPIHVYAGCISFCLFVCLHIGPDKDNLCTLYCIYFFTHQFKNVCWCSKESSH